MNSDQIESVAHYLEQEGIGTRVAVQRVGDVLREGQGNATYEPATVARQISLPEAEVSTVLAGYARHGLLERKAMLRCHECRMLRPLSEVRQIVTEEGDCPCEGYECEADMADYIEDEPVIVFTRE